MKEYYAILKELREDHDYNQSKIAQYLGTTQQVYSRYERGVNKMPVRHLRALCQFYQVSADYVLGLRAYPEIRRAQIAQQIFCCARRLQEYFVYFKSNQRGTAEKMQAKCVRIILG